MVSSNLSPVESAFLRIQTTDAPFVVACILELDRPIDVDTLSGVVGTALVDVPRYREYVRHGHWIRDPYFWIGRHVREACVASPGGPRELDDLAAALIGTDLSGDHPPWRMWTVRDLASGRGAIIAVVHHVLVDGVAGVRLLERMFGQPVPAEAAAPPPPRNPGVTWDRVRSLAQLLREGLHAAADIGFNPAHTSHSRAIASLALPLADVRAVARAAGGTVNDVLLATVSGALRRALHVDPRSFSNIRAMVPVSRHQGDGDTSGNRLAMLVLPLPVDEAEPSACLARVVATTADLKARHVAEGGDLISAAPPWILAGVLSFAVWNRAFNLIVTNVPGPRERLHVAGATVTRMVPVVNLWPHVGVGIAATTYADQLDLSVHVDFEAVPDFMQLRDAISDAFAALHRAAAGNGPVVSRAGLEP